MNRKPIEELTVKEIIILSRRLTTDQYLRFCNIEPVRELEKKLEIAADVLKTTISDSYNWNEIANSTLDDIREFLKENQNEV